MVSDTPYTPKWERKPAPKWERKPAPSTTPNVGTTDPQQTSYIATPVYCPFSKHPCGVACALFNAKLQRCGILAALENR